MSHTSSSSRSSRQHGDGHHSDEFAYQTRMVVYNFLGLVPSTPSHCGEDDRRASPDEVGESQLPDSEPRRTTLNEPSWTEDLNTLPSVTLFDRLNDAERMFEISSAVHREIEEKVVTCEPTSQDSLLRFGSVLRETGVPVSEHSKSDDFHRDLMGDIRRHRSPIDDDMQPMTIIQKRNKVKCLSEPLSTAVVDGERRNVLYPVPEMLQVPSSTYQGVETLGGTTSGNRKAKSGHDRSHSGSSSRGVKTPSSSSSSDGAISTNHVPGSAPSTVYMNGDGSGDQHSVLASSNDTSRDFSHNASAAGDSGVSERMDRHSSHDDGSDSHFAMDGSGSTENRSEVGATSTMDRQISGVSCGGSYSRRSTYVDIKDVDNIERLVASRALPPISLPLKRELSRAVTELDEKYGFDDADGVLSQAGGDASALSTPESLVADNLRVIGDRVQEEYGELLDEIVNDLMRSPRRALTYETIQSTSLRLLQHTHQGWTKVALVMLLGQRLVYGLLRQGYGGVGQVAEYTAMMIENHTADFIVNNGGWQSITELGVVETPAPLASDVCLPLMSSLNSDSPSLDNVDAVAVTVHCVEHQTIACEQCHSSNQVPTTAASNGSMEDGHDHVSDQRQVDRVSEDIKLLRQNSEMLSHDLAADSSSLALTQIGVVVGLGALVALSAYLVYRRQKSPA